MHEEISTLWNKTTSVSSNDLGRLARRIDVFVNPTAENGEDNNGVSSLGERESTNMRSNDRARDFANVIQVLSTHLETEEVNSKLPAAIDTFIKETVGQVDYRLYVKQLLSIYDFNTSALIKSLRLINQATLFIACIHMREALNKTKTWLKPDDISVKDCAGDDGWRVEIVITDRDITLRHIRRDQCLGAPVVPVGYWDVQWQLEVKFTPNMAEIISSKLRVLNMTFKDKFPARVEKELRRVYYESINHDFSFGATSDNVGNGSEEKFCWDCFGFTFSSKKTPM